MSGACKCGAGASSSCGCATSCCASAAQGKALHHQPAASRCGADAAGTGDYVANRASIDRGLKQRRSVRAAPTAPNGEPALLCPWGAAPLRAAGTNVADIFAAGLTSEDNGITLLRGRGNHALPKPAYSLRTEQLSGRDPPIAGGSSIGVSLSAGQPVMYSRSMSETPTVMGSSGVVDLRALLIGGEPRERDEIIDAQAAEWSSTQPYRLDYRTVQCGVPADFFWEWYTDWLDVTAANDSEKSSGVVSSVSDTLAALWSPFWADRKGDTDIFGSFLLCYNIPQSYRDVHSLFWCNGWGAPSKVYRYAMQLIRTYWSDLEYTPDYSRTDASAFGNFVRDLLDGKAPSSPAGNQCTLGVRIGSYDDRFAAVNEWCNGGFADCGSGAKPGEKKGYAYNYGAITWNAEYRCWIDALRSPWTGDQDAGDDPGELPSAGVDWNGSSDDRIADGIVAFSIAIPATDLYFRGLVCDDILQRAHIAWDYARYLRGEGHAGYAKWYEQQATRLARYALRIIQQIAGVLVHELGHVYYGFGHCDKDCMQEIAAEAWKCKTRARLGLAARPYSFKDGLDDYAAGSRNSRDEFTPCGGGCEFVSECQITENGVAGSDSAYCASVALNPNADKSKYTAHLHAESEDWFVSTTDITYVEEYGERSIWCSESMGTFR